MKKKLWVFLTSSVFALMVLGLLLGGCSKAPEPSREAAAPEVEKKAEAPKAPPPAAESAESTEEEDEEKKFGC